MFDTRLQHMYTRRFQDDEKSGSIRIMKVMSVDVKGEVHRLDALPKYLQMPEDHYVEEKFENSSAGSFSTSSFDSSDSSRDYDST